MEVIARLSNRRRGRPHGATAPSRSAESLRRRKLVRMPLREMMPETLRRQTITRSILLTHAAVPPLESTARDCMSPPAIVYLLRVRRDDGRLKCCCATSFDREPAHLPGLRAGLGGWNYCFVNWSRPLQVIVCRTACRRPHVETAALRRVPVVVANHGAAIRRAKLEDALRTSPTPAWSRSWHSETPPRAVGRKTRQLAHAHTRSPLDAVTPSRRHRCYRRMELRRVYSASQKCLSGTPGCRPCL